MFEQSSTVERFTAIPRIYE